MNFNLVPALFCKGAALGPSARAFPPRPFRARAAGLVQAAMVALAITGSAPLPVMAQGLGGLDAETMAQADPSGGDGQEDVSTADTEDSDAPEEGTLSDETHPDETDPDDTVGLIEAPATPRSAAPETGFAFNPAQAELSPDALASRDAALSAAPVVVELFTAQGCSSCPPADELIAALAGQPGVLTLSWHVDYWDYLGWTDPYADAVATERQQGYAAVAGERGVYTPQIIVDGQDTLLGVDAMGLLALIDDHAARPPAVIVTASESEGGFVLDLTPRAVIPGGVQVALIRYLPERRTDITRGETAGLTSTSRNIVVGAETLSRWPARAPLRLTVRASDQPGDAFPADTRHAILIQQIMPGGKPGPILSAIPLD